MVFMVVGIVRMVWDTRKGGALLTRVGRRPWQRISKLSHREGFDKEGVGSGSKGEGFDSKGVGFSSVQDFAVLELALFGRLR